MYVIELNMQAVHIATLDWTELHCESKKHYTKLLPINSPNINRFSIFFAGRLSGKFSTKPFLDIPPPIKYIATLPCEMRMSENWWESEICTHGVVQNYDMPISSFKLLRLRFTPVTYGGWECETGNAGLELSGTGNVWNATCGIT